MKNAKIYIPTKTAMQSGRAKLKNWVLEFDTKDSSINPLMGWETSSDTLKQISLRFSSKKQAIDYAEKNNISYKIRQMYIIFNYAHTHDFRHFD